MLAGGGGEPVWRRRGATVALLALALGWLAPRPAEAAATLELLPDHGKVSASFGATYRLQVVECFSAGQSVAFFWDDSPTALGVGTLDEVCTASVSLRPPEGSAVGVHTVRARWCTLLLCQNAAASYTVEVTPPPITTTTSTTTTTTSTTSTTTTTTITTVPPTTTTTTTSTVPPTTTTVAVTTTLALASAPPDRGSGLPDVARFVASTPGPGEVAVTGAVVFTNLLLTALLLLLFGTTSSVFNSTLDANREVIEGWGRRLRQGLRRVLPPATGLRLSPRGRLFLILGLTSAVYGFLSPGFGLDRASLLLLAALVGGIGALTYVSEGGAAWFSMRRLGIPAGVRVHGGALLAAVGCVLVSRMLGFQPGIVYGFIASAVLLGSYALDRRQAGEFAFYPAVVVLAIGVAAWAVLGWVRGGGLEGDLGDLAQSVLAVLSVGGIEGVMFSMVPLAFMDGRAVIEWSRTAWAVLAGVATFLFWQLLVNPNLAYLDAFRESGVKVVLGVAVGHVAVTAATWGYFRVRQANA